MTPIEREFLKESNAIEGVLDEASLKQAKVAWRYLKSQNKLEPHVILKTHKLLMLHQPRLLSNEKGYFRQIPIWVGGRQGSPHALVRQAIEAWCKKSLQTTPQIDTKALHVEYEKIHPFVDGNGRTGRMFMNWQRLKITKEPLIIIHAGTFEQTEYYGWFEE